MLKESRFLYLIRKQFPLILICILAIFLRFYRISSQSMWFDEALSLAYAQLSLLDIIRMVISDTQAPFYYLFLHIWILLGESEFILRMSSAIFGIASVYLVYIVAEKIFDKRTGLISAFIISISPFNIYYSHIYTHQLQ